MKNYLLLILNWQYLLVDINLMFLYHSWDWFVSVSWATPSIRVSR